MNGLKIANKKNISKVHKEKQFYKKILRRSYLNSLGRIENKKEPACEDEMRWAIKIW